jgi:rfaE bifunctional protein nucleotidyltransferase chain/domain
VNATGPGGERPARRKIVGQGEAQKRIQQAHQAGERVVFTNGCFDVLHVGHVRSLEEARSLGDRLIVAVNRDASVRRLKGASRPIVPERQRAEMLAALESVDWVVLFGGETPLSVIRALRPDVLAKGGDWKLDEIVGRAEVESWGGRVARLHEIPGIRTTSLLERILAGSGPSLRTKREPGRSRKS